MKLEELAQEKIDQLAKLETSEEVFEFLADEGIELTDDQLNLVNGGIISIENALPIGFTDNFAATIVAGRSPEASLTDRQTAFRPIGQLLTAFIRPLS